MFRVRVSTSFPEWPLDRQTPGRSGIWGDFQFVIDQPVDDYHFWVVYDRFTSPLKGRCARSNVLFFTAEPPSLARYPRRFLAQFGQVITCQRNVRHPNVIFTHQALPWHIGIGSYYNRKGTGNLLDYDYLKSAKIEKTKVLSVIASANQGTRGHGLRFRFVQFLRERLGDRIDVFGHGIRELGDKWDGIAPYQYHVTIENSTVPDYWTEKIADAFLGGAFPLYHGCPNIGQYFPADSLRPIDISDPESALKIIETTIASNAYERCRAQVAEARRLVLEEYNLFPMLARLLSQKDAAAPKESLEFEPIGQFEGANVKLVRMITRRLPRRVRQLLK